MIHICDTYLGSDLNGTTCMQGKELGSIGTAAEKRQHIATLSYAGLTGWNSMALLIDTLVSTQGADRDRNTSSGRRANSRDVKPADCVIRRSVRVVTIDSH